MTVGRPNAGLPMPGGDYYHQHSLHQAQGAAMVAPLAERLVQSLQVELHSGEPYCIVDYGAADGGNSAGLLARVVERVWQAHGRGKDIAVYHTDLPDTDWGALFRRAHCPGGYHDDTQHPGGSGTGGGAPGGCGGVFTYAIGLSFFEQLLPRDSVCFRFAGTCFHWASEYVWPPQERMALASAATPTSRRRASLAADDWARLLCARARELRVGGRLLLTMPAPGPRGENTLRLLCGAHVVQALQGMVGEAEAAGVQWPSVHRTLDEMLAPLRDPTSEPYCLGLRVDSSVVEPHVAEVPNPYYASWLQHRDNDRFAGEYVSCLRCISEALLARALGALRPEPEAAQLLETCYDRVTQLVAHGRINDYEHDYWQSVLAVTKVAAD